MLAGVPEQVRHPTASWPEYHETLAQLVSDEMVRLEREFARHKNTAASELLRGYLRGIAHLKEQALHAYRDELTRARHKRAALVDVEGLRYRLWRTLTRRGHFGHCHGAESAEAAPRFSRRRRTVFGSNRMRRSGSA